MYSVWLVWVEGRWGFWSCVVDHILQDFYTLFLTRFRTYKIASPPQTKMTSKDDIKRLVSLKFLRLWVRLSPQHCSSSFTPAGESFQPKTIQLLWKDIIVRDHQKLKQVSRIKFGKMRNCSQIICIPNIFSKILAHFWVNQKGNKKQFSRSKAGFEFTMEPSQP